MKRAYSEKFDCERCPTRCDGTSKMSYVFEDDVTLSEGVEDWLAARLTRTIGVSIRKTPGTAHGLPDLELFRGESVIARVEVKAQGRAFMKVASLLPRAELLPYETVALNLSDLDRYIALYEREQVPLFLIWRVKRPCLGLGHWGQRIEVLREIRNRFGDARRLRRRSAPSDYVDGEHKGVTVNYHFSIYELMALKDVERDLRVVCGSR